MEGGGGLTRISANARSSHPRSPAALTHWRRRQLYAELAPALSAIESGNNDPLLDATATATLATEYLAHARLEEEVLLPLAQTILGRNSHHMAALGLALHIRHAAVEVRRKFGFI